MGNVVLGTYSYDKCDWGKFFPKIVKWLTPSIKDKKVTYSDSSLKLWTKRKDEIELIPGVVACMCNPATLEAEFRNGVGSIPVGGNSPSIGGWIVWPPVIQH